MQDPDRLRLHQTKKGRGQGFLSLVRALCRLLDLTLAVGYSRLHGQLGREALSDHLSKNPLHSHRMATSAKAREELTCATPLVVTERHLMDEVLTSEIGFQASDLYSMQLLSITSRFLNLAN
jgi:hypothetical protein